MDKIFGSAYVQGYRQAIITVIDLLENHKRERDGWQRHGAVEYVKKLIDEGYDVYLCTTTDYRNVRPKFENVIQKHFPYINWNQVIIASRKQMINADVLVDDGVHNLENGNYIKILVSAPHNASYDAKGNGMYRVDNWEEIYELIHSLIGEPYEN